MNETPPTRKKKKTLNACQRCRSRKIKCSGHNPCQHCVSRAKECIFEERAKKLIVTEDYLRELQNRASTLESTRLEHDAIQTSPIVTISLQSKLGVERTTRLHHASMRGSSPSTLHEQNHQFMTTPDPLRRISRTKHSLYPGQLESDHEHRERQGSNGLPGSSDSQYAIGDEYRRLGHSSSWSFSRRIRNMINDVTKGPELHDKVPIRDGAFGVPWRTNAVDMSAIDLPTEEYAEYLTNTVNFTMGSLYCLFDEAVFLERLHGFYTDMCSGHIDQSRGLWHVQMLVVFAFGKSILAKEAGPSGPTGAEYFARALEGLPDAHHLYQEPTLAVEILCMFALFLQALDMRSAAYDYIGRAVRIGSAHGLNRRFDSQRITRKEFEHRSRLWWTIYIIDRKLSSLIGVPPTIHDDDIALPKPTIDTDNGKEIAMAFHVELSSQLGQILNVVYGLGLQRQLGGHFIAAIQSILHRLADVSISLDRGMKLDLQRPTNTLSRVAASLHILLHLCSILAIRPVLFFLLEKKLANHKSVLMLSDAVIGLLRVCVESALQVSKIVEALRIHKLVDLLFPFDLDAVFAASLVLVLADIIAPAAEEQRDLSKTFTLIDEMTLRGIVTASPYKKDLLELSALRQRLRDQHQTETTQSSRAIPTTIESLMPDSTPISNDAMPYHHLEQDPIWSSMTADSDNLGILDPNTIQSAIDGLNFDFLDDPSAIEMSGSEWMWASRGTSDTPWSNVL